MKIKNACAIKLNDYCIIDSDECRKSIIEGIGTLTKEIKRLFTDNNFKELSPLFFIHDEKYDVVDTVLKIQDIIESLYSHEYSSLICEINLIRISEIAPFDH